MGRQRPGLSREGTHEASSESKPNLSLPNTDRQASPHMRRNLEHERDRLRYKNQTTNLGINRNDSGTKRIFIILVSILKKI